LPGFFARGAHLRWFKCRRRQGAYAGISIVLQGIATDHSFDPSDAVHPAAEPRVRQVALGAPIEWLRRGARDLRRSAGPSLRVGLAVAAAGWLLMAAGWRIPHLVPALLGGFLLVAPLAATGIYAYARQLEHRDRVASAEARLAWRANASSIALFGVLLVLAFLVWERVAATTFALFYRGEPLHLSTLASTLVLSSEHVPLLVTLGGAGGLIAAAVFALSVVSLPLPLDRPVDVVTAVIASVQCCLRNPLAMLLWALLIVFITAAGLATLMVGLVVVFPWLAHASWHAYRAMVTFEP